MKILFIINSSRHKKHNKLMNDVKTALESKHEYLLVDMAANKELHLLYRDIIASHANLVITFDMAGFELRTEGNETSLNLLTQRVVHLLFDKPYKYQAELSEWLNLSHFLFVPADTDIDEFVANHSNIPNVMAMPDWNNNSISEWFERISKELMLE